MYNLPQMKKMKGVKVTRSQVGHPTTLRKKTNTFTLVASICDRENFNTADSLPENRFVDLQL